MKNLTIKLDSDTLKLPFWVIVVEFTVQLKEESSRLLPGLAVKTPCSWQSSFLISYRTVR